jgi:hypothetical protein
MWGVSTHIANLRHCWAVLSDTVREILTKFIVFVDVPAKFGNLRITDLACEAYSETST